jgi:hypothetical protein
MCLICVQLSKDLLTVPEAWRNLHEMSETLEEEHVEEVLDLIWERIMDRTEEFNEMSFIFD